MKTSQLTSRKVQTAKTPGYYGDGGGLYLQVSNYGTRSWVFRFMVAGRAREMGLGSLETFSLKEARARARECRQFVSQGIDPIEDRRKKRDEARAASGEAMPFKKAAQLFLEVHVNGWRNVKHQQQWANTLQTYAFPTLGTRPVAAINGALITVALAPIWTAKPETSRRVKQRIERVVQWVKDGMPLPIEGASKRTRHHPAMPYEAVPGFMVRLRANESISARALEFCILTASRTGEAIGATWAEIDLDARIWTVPADRMKSGKEHEVPLSKRAIEILKALPREKGSVYVFPGARAGKPLSNMAMLELLRGMNSDGYTTHGFRSSFRDWAGEQSSFPREVIEHALAHRIKDKAEAAYARGTLLPKRQKLMEAWGSYCAAPLTGATVTPLRRAQHG